eukprot:1152980-Pelagomonas_calceolata.AAC.1
MAGIFYPKGAVSDWCSGARGNNTDCGSGEEPPRGQKSNKHMGYIKLFALSTNISTLLHNCCKTHAVRGNWGMKQSIAVQAQHIGNDSRHDDMARFAQARKSQERILAPASSVCVRVCPKCKRKCTLSAKPPIKRGLITTKAYWFGSSQDFAAVTDGTSGLISLREQLESGNVTRKLASSHSGEGQPLLYVPEVSVVS